MSSVHTVHTSYAEKRDQDRMQEAYNLPTCEHPRRIHLPPIPYHSLSPSSSSQFVHHGSASPTLSNTIANTPTASASTLSNTNIHTPADSASIFSPYDQSSDFTENPAPIADAYWHLGVQGDLADPTDPFFVLGFGGEPSSLEPSQAGEFPGEQPYSTPDQNCDVRQNQPYHLMSPDNTPSRDTASPAIAYVGLRSNYCRQVPVSASISPQELAKPFSQPTAPVEFNNTFLSQLTPVTNKSGSRSGSGSGRSSDVEFSSAAAVMSARSPHVTVSFWGKEIEGIPPSAQSYTGTNYAGVPTSAVSPVRDAEGQWLRDEATGHQGVEPDKRLSDEVGSSINELGSQREVDEKNQEVQQWLTGSADQPIQNPNEDRPSSPTKSDDDHISPREIPLGDRTENKAVPGQTYFLTKGGEITQADISLMVENRNWSDAPLLPSIQNNGIRNQPETSAEAMRKLEQMMKDNDSVMSRSATWGTRRHSLPSSLDIEVVSLSGNFLKKLNIGRGSEPRRPSLISRVLRNSSTSFKRARSSIQEEEAGEPSADRRDSQQSLAPPARTPSGGLGGLSGRRAFPSINTALVSVSASAAAIATTHVRSGSINNTTPTITSPRSPNTLSVSVEGVRNMLGRRRSGSELVGMLRKSGGVPVAKLPRTPATSAIPFASAIPLAAATSAAADLDDDEDEDDDMCDEIDVKKNVPGMIDDVNPTITGFREYILKLNPMLHDQEFSYLVERIAYQQCQRYKNLLLAKVTHLKNVSSKSCLSGTMCIAQGGSANYLDGNGDTRQDPLSASRYDGSDEDGTPLEGTIRAEAFPPAIPMPPTSTLPAEFECQLCFHPRRVQKPSDWTKHVHEDVQPFTCTWERCRESKTFKRKADWVRHENEGHRHLEWWTCDVDDCRHVCYRRDNFLQHLVREHKFTEPKVKTKAAIKRSGTQDPTWQKVEKCHEETKGRPQDEPCRFCGMTFPTWKKLTVHLAKHMEDISLPILRLVARKDLDADTIISPVQEPPPRPFSITPTSKSENMRYAPNPSLHYIVPPNVSQAPTLSHPANHLANPIGYPNAQLHGPYGYPLIQAAYLNPPLQFNMNTGIDTTTPIHMSASQSYGHVSIFSSMPNAIPATTTGGTYVNHTYPTVPQETEPFPTFSLNNALGLQGIHDGSVGAGGNCQIAYGHNVMDSSSPADSQFTSPHESVSPFMKHSPHSPNHGRGQFYTHPQ